MQAIERQRVEKGEPKPHRAGTSVMGMINNNRFTDRRDLIDKIKRRIKSSHLVVWKHLAWQEAKKLFSIISEIRDSRESRLEKRHQGTLVSLLSQPGTPMRAT